MLVEYAMWWDLQANGLRREILRQEINARLGGPVCAGGWKCALSFLYPAGTSWDAPAVPAALGAPAAAASAVPGADVLNVRAAAGAALTAPAARAAAVGSNSWAVAGRLTATGAALIANDMHLGQRVPPVWYHARLTVKGGSGERGARSERRDAAGGAAAGRRLQRITSPGALPTVTATG